MKSRQPKRSSKASSRYQTLLEISNALTAKLDRKELMDAVFSSIRSVLPFDTAALGILEADGHTERMFALDGTKSGGAFEIDAHVNIGSIEKGSGFDYTKPLLRHDLAMEREYYFEEQSFAEGSRSHIIVPLFSQGKCIGSFGIGSREPNRYDEADLEFLQQIGNQVSLAVANMLAYEESRELIRRETASAARRKTLLEINNAIITSLTQEELINSVSDALKRIVPLDHVAFALHEPSTDRGFIYALEGGYKSSIETGQGLSIVSRFTGKLYDFRPLLRRDFSLEVEREFEGDCVAYADGLLSMCIVPLKVKSEPTGIMAVGSRNREQYDEGDLEFIQEVANQVALAVANMRSFEEIKALKAQLQAENVYLQEEILQEHNFEEIIGNSPELLAVLRQIERVAPTDATVLITGETGTGKELVARGIHNLSGRKNRPLVKINCGAISAGLVESELFGHVKGAFTGATEKRVGRFELANGGTIFLDEVGELPLETQVKLLRVLQEGEFESVGSSGTMRTDVRVIAATNRDLPSEIAAGRFRADLFYRLSVFPITVPPLRDRRSDIPALVMFFVERYAKKFGRQLKHVPVNTMDRLMRYDWMGNVRELQNIIERAVVLSSPNVQTLDLSLIPIAEHFPSAGVEFKSRSDLLTGDERDGHRPASGSIREIERRHIIATLERTEWVIEGPNGAARILDIHPNTLRSRLKKLNIRRPAKS